MLSNIKPPFIRCSINHANSVRFLDFAIFKTIYHYPGEGLQFLRVHERNKQHGGYLYPKDASTKMKQ